MTKKYYAIILTPVPSFYKLRLFNEMAKKKRLLVIYTGAGSEERNADFFKGTMDFDYLFLPDSQLSKLIAINKLLIKLDYQHLIISGWDCLSGIWAGILSKRSKNACIVESSIYESEVKGMRAFIKRTFLKRITTVLASGKPQQDLVRALGYKNKIVEFGGCGLLNYQIQPSYSPRKEVKTFLYVGRLSPEKNLPLLLSVFKKHSNLQLNIVGFGPQEKELKSSATANIHFWGAIDNQKLAPIYQQADVFILPSKSEPWGLVIEEALNNGTPVIVSDRVGCKDDLVNNDTGLVFQSGNADDLERCVCQMLDTAFYNHLRLSVSKMDFMARAQRQVNCFLNLD